MSEPLLSIRDLTVRVGPSQNAPAIIEDVSLDLQPGETLGLVGESGSGKSTLGMSILRLAAPPLDKGTSGSIIYKGRDVRKLSNRNLHTLRGGEISMILQDPMASLNPVFSIGAQLKEALRRVPGHRELDGAAANALAEVKIPSPRSRLKSYPHQMSGGMRQRIVSAIALAQTPELLICDEPTTSLDVTIQYQFLELLAELQKAHHMAMLFITHDFGVVAKTCDRVAIMYAGQIVESGPVREIFHNPRHWYTRALLASVPRTDEKPARLPQIAGAPPSVTRRPSGCRFHPRCEAASALCSTEPKFEIVAEGHALRCFHPAGGGA